MCGITGLIEKRGSSNLNPKEVIRTMTQTLVHRGPDEEAYYLGEDCQLGMRRLSILDLSPNLYPFTNDNRNLKLVFNGEIYNYKNLKYLLEQEGHIFKSDCDGEVILKGYEEWGTRVFSKLRGMFAIALYDENQKELILVRDRLGIKPIYYTDSADFFAFASEAKALYSLKDCGYPIDLELDQDKTKELLGFMFLPDSSNTIVKSVKKLEPGSILRVSNQSGVEVTKYWQLKENPELSSVSYKDALEMVENKLVESVEMHLLSDVPLGVMLSGGLDSSLITAIMAKKLGNPVQTYTAKFDHKFNESDLARETAQQLGTEHTEILIDTNEINQNIDKYIRIFDDLTTFDGGAITTAVLSSQIRTNGTKVLLLGEGADELFGGYSWFGLSQPPFRYFPKTVREALYYYAISRNISFNFNFYSNIWKSKTIDASNMFNDISHKELTTQLPNHLLMKVDKGSMYSSIEARVPYLDHELVEMVYSLPAKFKLNGSFFNPKKANEKRILRDIALKYLPENTAFRKKRGFLLPMKSVLESNKDKVQSLIMAADAISSKLLSTSQRQSLFNASGNSFFEMQNEYLLWRLFLIESWAEYYGIR